MPPTLALRRVRSAISPSPVPEHRKPRLAHPGEAERAFVLWWDEQVRRPGQGNNADQRYFSVEAAETHTGISQQQVSKWRQRLKDVPAYRDALYGPAYRKAMAERGQTDQQVSKWRQRLT